MKRKIIKIDQSLCNGCGLCVTACHEGAIAMQNGKATLLRDDYCDGLGDCLPVCPTNAISFEEREALPYNHQEVLANQAKKSAPLPCGCPGSNARSIPKTPQTQTEPHIEPQSQLSQWPVQIKLAPTNAPFFNNARLLISADCAAYAYASFHQHFIKGKIVLIGCPKLDSENYAEKLTEIIKNNNIISVDVVRMEVPCCGGLEQAAITALKQSGKFIPWQVHTISTNGNIISR